MAPNEFFARKRRLFGPSRFVPICPLVRGR